MTPAGGSSGGCSLGPQPHGLALRGGQVKYRGAGTRLHPRLGSEASLATPTAVFAGVSRARGRGPYHEPAELRKGPPPPHRRLERAKSAPPAKPEGPIFFRGGADGVPWVHTVEEQAGLVYALDVKSGLYILRVTE